MASVCARCLVKFPGAEGGRRFRWCSLDGFYVCERCWFRECPPAHGLAKRGSGPWVASVVAVLALSIIFGTTLPILASEYASTAYWSTAPLTSIAALQVGEVAKVSGSILSADYVAYGGSIQTVCTHTCSLVWQWNWTSIFYLKDASGTTLVRVQRPWTTFPGAHAALWGSSVGGTYYARNDTVYVVGTVDTLDNGTKGLQVDYISPSPLDPPPDAAALGLMALFASCLLVAWTLWGHSLLSRRARHARAIRGRKPIVLQQERIEPNPSLPWVVNQNPEFPRKRGPGNGQLAGTAAFGLVTTFFFTAIALESGPLFFLLPLFLFNGCVVLPLLVRLYYRMIRPPTAFAVAFVEQGVYFAYESPYARKLYDPLLPWSDVGLKARPSRRKGGPTAWVVDGVAGRADDSFVLSAPNWKTFCEGWKRHADSVNRSL